MKTLSGNLANRSGRPPLDRRAENNAHGLPFRPNVAALVRVGDCFLACERASGEGWQCVQGGVEPTDGSLEEALRRELSEELGVDASRVEIARRSRFWRRYRFPPGASSSRKEKYQGQEQLWFLVHLPGIEAIKLEQSSGEFRSVKLVSIRELVDLFVHWKRPSILDFCRELDLIS
jgi:8-oxo-dGTP pyrophosphatase MutT (NUDIX family)